MYSTKNKKIQVIFLQKHFFITLPLTIKEYAFLFDFITFQICIQSCKIWLFKM